MKDRIIKETEELPSELQEKIIKLVRSMKRKMLGSMKEELPDSDRLLPFGWAVMEVVG